MSRNVPGFHEELAQRVAASASVSANLPTSQPVIHREERSEVPPQRAQTLQTPRVDYTRTQRSNIRVTPHGESPDSSPSDSEDEPQAEGWRCDTPPHIRRRQMPQGRRDQPPPRRQPSPPRGRPPPPPRRAPSPPQRRSQSPPDRHPQQQRRNPSSSPSPSNSSSEPSRHRMPFDNVRPQHLQLLQIGVGVQEMTGEEYSRRLLQYFEDMINLQVTHSIYYP